MTMIDPFSYWFEIAPILGDPNSHRCNRTLYYAWLSRYPQGPQLVGSDGGSAFKLNFEQLCSIYGIKHFTIGAWNPQANVVLKGIHQVPKNF